MRQVRDGEGEPNILGLALVSGDTRREANVELMLTVHAHWRQRHDRISGTSTQRRALVPSPQ
jgi:hypothetical protein